MNITVDKSELQTSIAFAGNITIYSVAELKGELLAHLTKASKVEIDLSEVSEFDTAGLQVLILAKKEANLIQCELTMKAHSPAVLQIFELYDVAHYFGDPLLISTTNGTEQTSERRNV